MISRESLLTLESYTKLRSQVRTEVMPHRRLRTVYLGEHLTLQFEDEITIRYQIQEMLRVEKIFDEAGIQNELDAYNPLVPDGSNWKATMLIEYPEVEQRKIELARLIGIEDRIYIQPQGFQSSYAIADEDLDRETAEKTSAVHFLRFEFNNNQIAAMRDGLPVLLGCDHPNYTMTTTISAPTLAALRKDFG
jgi:hypothetical protein